MKKNNQAKRAYRGNLDVQDFSNIEFAPQT